MQNFHDERIHRRSTRIDYHVIIAELVYNIDQTSGPADHSVSARALSSFQLLDRAGHAHSEHVQSIESAYAALIHGAIVEHVVEDDGIAPIH